MKTQAFRLGFFNNPILEHNIFNDIKYKSVLH